MIRLGVGAAVFLAAALFTARDLWMQSNGVDSAQSDSAIKKPTTESKLKSKFMVPTLKILYCIS